MTTIFENRRNALKPLQRNGFNGRLLSPEICAESLKALLSQGFPFVCQKTPTFLTDPAEIRRKALQAGALAERQRKKRCEPTTV